MCNRETIVKMRRLKSAENRGMVFVRMCACVWCAGFSRNLKVASILFEDLSINGMQNNVMEL